MFQACFGVDPAAGHRFRRGRRRGSTTGRVPAEPMGGPTMSWAPRGRAAGRVGWDRRAALTSAEGRSTDGGAGRRLSASFCSRHRRTGAGSRFHAGGGVGFEWRRAHLFFLFIQNEPDRIWQIHRKEAPCAITDHRGPLIVRRFDPACRRSTRGPRRRPPCLPTAPPDSSGPTAPSIRATATTKVSCPSASAKRPSAPSGSAVRPADHRRSECSCPSNWMR
jgi:hypothetical protein